MVMRDGEIDKIINFAMRGGNTYIYGAGNYGRRYYEFLNGQNIDVAGFIVTQKENVDFEYCGKKVFSLSESKEILQDGDGIIPAFEHSVSAEIRVLFDKKIDVLDVDHMVFLRYITDLRFRPLVEEFMEQYGSCEKNFRKEDMREILVIRTDAIGDLICTTAFLRELRRNYLKSRITVVIRNDNRLILKNCPYIDRLWFYDSDMVDGEIYEQSAQIDKVKKQVGLFAREYFDEESFDMVFLPRELMAGRNIFDDLLLALQSGAAVRIGHVINTDILKQYVYQSMQELFTKISYTGQAKHEVQYQLDMLLETGHIVQNDKMELWVSKDVLEDTDNQMRKLGVREDDFLIAVGFVASVPARTWHYERYKELFEMSYKTYGSHVIFLILGGIDAAKEYEESMIELDNVISFAGKTSLEESISIIKACDLYIGSNTGLLHMASACNVPSVTVYAELTDGLETDGDHPVKMGSWGVEGVSLQPSGLDGCHRVCRVRKSHCINQISADMVFAEMDKFIRRKKK